MATLEILAAFGFSFLFMLLLWTLKDRLFRPVRQRKKSRLALLITDEDVPERARADEAGDAASPQAETEN